MSDTDPAVPIANSHNLRPIVETFTLETMLPPRLLESVDWYYERQGIRDPEEAIARLYNRPDQVGYNGFMADFLSYASTWSYADPATFAFMMAHRGMKKWRYYYMHLGNDPLYVVSSAYLMQSYTGDVSILVFRGTEPTSTIKWLTDPTISLDRFLEGEVHGGILRNLKAIWPLVSMGLHTVDTRKNLMLLSLSKRGEEGPDMAELEPDGHADPSDKFYARAYEEKRFDDPRKKVRPVKSLYITGHGLGGAMAALAAAHIWKNPEWREVRENLFGCYTYGAPMVASPLFADLLHQELGALMFRHVYAYDVVPQLPPLTTGRFKHFGKEYRCVNKGEGWMLCDKPATQTRYATWLPLAGLSLVAEQFPILREWMKNLPISIDHHSPRYYMSVSELSRTATF